MPRGNNYLTLQLGSRLGHRYDGRWMETLTARCAFHKMNYRVDKATVRNAGNFYNEILRCYGRLV
ncbi:MAG: hypothetical protein NC388_01140 [Clostridium sp.]|nr:hypothetical protein [Clostridium sp.]